LSADDLTDSRILIVDDQPANLGALSSVLQMRGYNNVKCLNDSRQAVQVVAEYEPDLILLDLHMPHMDGLAVMDQLPTVVDKDDFVPVLVLTGDGTAGAKEKALARGAQDFLSKPLNGTEVNLRVKNLLQTRNLHRQLKAQNSSLEATNRKLKEAQSHLIQSEKMASLGQLVAGIAHEINNPLAFVINNLFLVREGLGKLAAQTAPDLFPESHLTISKMCSRVNEMQEGTDRVKDLVSKLRTFSRLDEGKFKTIDIHESIESVLLFLRHKTEGRIQVERQYGDLHNLSCFAGELNQVLMNVIANGIDSIRSEGKITVQTTEESGFVVIKVSDTGGGIPQQIRNRVFEPFFTTKPVGHGTGLGLAISYGIMQAHKGSIDFLSKVGEGTQFVLRIPTSLESEG